MPTCKCLATQNFWKGLRMWTVLPNMNTLKHTSRNRLDNEIFADQHFNFSYVYPDINISTKFLQWSSFFLNSDKQWINKFERKDKRNCTCSQFIFLRIYWKEASVRLTFVTSVPNRLRLTQNVFINLLKPTGHVMHQLFNIQQLYVLPTLYLCVLCLSENKQRLVPLTA